MGHIMGQMQSDSAQLQGYMQQLPEEARARIRQLTDSYSEFEDTINRASQDIGVEDSLQESAEQARQNADQASGQGPTDVAAAQAQEVAGQATQQAQDTAGQAIDQAGQLIGQTQDAVGGLLGDGEDQPGEQEMDDYSYSDSDANTVVNDKSPEGILGQLLNLEILPSPTSDTTTMESGDSDSYYGPEGGEPQQEEVQE